MPLIIGFISAVNGPYLYTLESVRTEDNTFVCMNVHWLYFSNVVMQYIESVVYVFFPVVSLTLINICIIYELRRFSKARQKLNRQGSDETRAMTVTMLSVTIAFVSLMLPFAVSAILDIIARHDDSGGQSQFFEVARLLALTNHGINFFLYTASTPNFRQELWTIAFGRCTRVSLRSDPTNMEGQVATIS